MRNDNEVELYEFSGRILIECVKQCESCFFLRHRNRITTLRGFFVS